MPERTVGTRRLHFIWDHAEGLAEPWLCWCGEDHPDDNGLMGQAKYVAPDDPGWVPATAEHLDSLYLEAWLGGHDHA